MDVLKVEDRSAWIWGLVRYVLILAADPEAHLIIIVEVNFMQAQHGGVDAEFVFQVCE